MTKLLQSLRDELVRRDYAAPTIRSYVQILEAFRQHSGATRSNHPGPAPTLPFVSPRGTAAGCWDGGHLDLRAAVLLPLCAEAARRARGPAVSEAATPLADHAQSRRSPAPDCGCEESLPPHAAADSLRRGLAPQRSAPAQSPRHRQPTDGAPHRAGQGRARSRDPSSVRRFSPACVSTTGGCDRGPVSFPGRATAGVPMAPITTKVGQCGAIKVIPQEENHLP